MTLAERMVIYRAKERLSQKDLAQQCGVTLQTINNIENETQTPSRVTVAKIELVIGREEKKDVKN